MIEISRTTAQTAGECNACTRPKGGDRMNRIRLSLSEHSGNIEIRLCEACSAELRETI